jgi:pyruvate dehydrogenase E2 component (dihydrolipoamide acetyltransferase)
VAVEVTMPKFGLTMHEGTIQRFFKSPGETVKAGEPLYEVETEKILYEVESPAGGTLAAALFDEGAIVECGIAVAVIAEPGEDVGEVAARYARAAATPATNHAPAQHPASVGARASADTSAAAGARRAISPVARKLAAELGVDLERVAGTGPGGRVTREDVERAAKEPAGRAAAKTPSAPRAQAGSAAPDAKRIALRGTRKVIAERMHQSLQASAQLTIASEADVTPATELRARLTRDFDFTYTDMLVHACARALLKHPRMNSHLEADEIVVAPDVNVGIAVALDEGLIVPVIRNADRLALREIAIESRALAEKAHASRLRLEDVHGGTFTISNLGTYGVDTFTPILNPGETGILGVGRIVEKPAIYRGEITRRAMLTLSLTFDHRVIDGAPAAEFLQTVIEILNYGER